jgi:hypothetical protein
MFYDEVRGINLLADGSPFVDSRRGGETRTLTLVSDEAADDDDDRYARAIITKTAPKDEADDFQPDSSVGTVTITRVRQEPDDEDRDARAGDGLFVVGDFDSDAYSAPWTLRP